MSIRSGLGHLAFAIGTWVLLYVFLRFMKAKHPGLITGIALIVNFALFPFAIEYIHSPGSTPPFSLVELFCYLLFFAVFGPLSILVNLKFLYLVLIKG